MIKNENQKNAKIQYTIVTQMKGERILKQTKTLANGVEMPVLGLGVYKMTNRDETLQAIEAAIATGYRAIDTAALYYNEEEVGEAIRNSSVPREELFITTKVWNTDQGYDNTLRAFETSLKKLDLQYVDLYLTHWAVIDKYEETYRAIERLYDEKLIRVPGVSNHQPHHIDRIIANGNIPPMVNQVELHPYLSQKPLRDYCAQHDIAVTAWSPLGRGTVLQDPTLQSIAAAHGKSPAQVTLRWELQNGIITIPKSVTPERIKENFNVFDFELSMEEMAQIDQLNRDERIGKDPDNFHFDM